MTRIQAWLTKQSTRRGLFRVWLVGTVVYLGVQTYNLKDDIAELVEYHFTSKEAYISKRVNHYCKTVGYQKFLSNTAKENPKTKEQYSVMGNPYLALAVDDSAAIAKCKNEVRYDNYPSTDSIKYSYSIIAKNLIVPPLAVPLAIAFFAIALWLIFRILRWIRIGFKD